MPKILINCASLTPNFFAAPGMSKGGGGGRQGGELFAVGGSGGLAGSPKTSINLASVMPNCLAAAAKSIRGGCLRCRSGAGWLWASGMLKLTVVRSPKVKLLNPSSKAVAGNASSTRFFMVVIIAAKNWIAASNYPNMTGDSGD
jgi:hypothetical protein